jgi:hypothetical protein
VIVVAVVLVTCALLFCNATAVVEAKISTALTVSGPSSAQVKQSFSITGKLTANGATLTNKIVSLQRLSGTAWTTLASQTATTGTYSFSRTETTAAACQYRTIYAGSASYTSATSPTVTVTVSQGVWNSATAPERQTPSFVSHALVNVRVLRVGFECASRRSAP